MKKSLGLFIASMFVIFGLTVISASAQNSKYGVNQRQKNQQKRIIKGVYNGSVTGKEFKKLEGQQIKTQKAKQHAKSDGEVTPKERFRLQKRLTYTSHSIYRAKHNNRGRTP